MGCAQRADAVTKQTHNTGGSEKEIIWRRAWLAYFVVVKFYHQIDELVRKFYLRP